MSLIGERMKRIRKDKNLTQKDFGQLLGISHSHVSNIENGKENPSTTLLLMISAKFNINDRWLNFGEGMMHTVETNQKWNDLLGKEDHMKKMLLQKGKVYGVGDNYFRVICADEEKAVCEDLHRNWEVEHAYYPTRSVWVADNVRSHYQDTEFIKEKTDIFLSGGTVWPQIRGSLSLELE